MNVGLMLRSIDNIGNTLEHPKGWFGLCTIFLIIDHYIFSQWNFAIGFFMIFIIDTIVGSYCAYQMRLFSFYNFRKKLADKSLAYFTIILSYSIGTKIVLDDGSASIIHYLDIPFYSLFVTVELGSVIKNWYEYKRWPFLKKLMKHFEGYNSDTGKEIKP